MSETPSERQTGISKPIVARVLWRLSIALLWFVSICAGALAAVTLWVIVGFSPEPQRSDADSLGSQFEARKGESLEGGGPFNVTGAARPDLRREPGAQGRSEAEAASRSIASSVAFPPAQKHDKGGASADRSSGAPNCTDQPIDGPHRLCASGSSSPDAAEPKKATKEPQIDMGAGADQPQPVREPQDRRPAARQQETPTALTDLRPRAQCNLDRCAARYQSFRAADCTYQPHGGGPRSFCELSTGSAEAAPQTSRAATDPISDAKHTRVAETGEVPKSASPARAGAQCNVNLCASTYASFHAADCTYQPYDGGPRRICER